MKRRVSARARSSRLLLVALLVGILVPFLGGGALPASAAPGDLTQVSLIGDSTMAAMEWYLYDNADADQAANNDIREIVANSYDLTFSAESCRRLVNPSCTGRFGSRPLSTLPLMTTTLKGHLGQAMVVMAGYDDASIASAVDQVMAEAEAQGVVKVYWLTYRTGTSYVLPGGLPARNLYQSHNAELAAASGRHAALQVLDWNAFSADKVGWFTGDGIHLTTVGAVGLATYIKDTLDAAQPVIGRCRNSSALTGTLGGSTGDEPASGPRSGFVPIAPTRVLDTRDPSFDVNGKLGAQRTVSIDLDDVVPDGASSVAMSVTAVESCLPGFLTVFPCGPRPPTSNVNYEVGRTTAGMAISAMSDRHVCVFASTATDVVVDVTGAFTPTGDAFHPISPTRFVDTRGQPALLTDVVGEKSTAADTRVAIRGSSGIPDSARAVWVNLTVAEPGASTVLLAYPGPCGSPPLASTVNARVAHNTASSALVGVGSDGSICVRTYSGRSHVVVDVAGWFGPGSGGLMYESRAAQRLLDTRPSGTGLSTAARSAPIDGVSVLNVTAADSVGAGFVSARPCGVTAMSSLINTTRDEDTANVIAVAPGAGGEVCAQASSPSQIIIDRIGVFVP